MILNVATVLDICILVLGPGFKTRRDVMKSEAGELAPSLGRWGSSKAVELACVRCP